MPTTPTTPPTPTPSTGQVLEVATITVLPGHERAFEAAVAEAIPLFEAAQGALAMSLAATVERPTVYRLLVTWASLDDHLVGFRESAAFVRWRELIGPHLDGAPEVEHLRTAVTGF